MNSDNISFTDFAQLDKLNENVFKNFARNYEIGKDMKSGAGLTAARAQSAFIGDTAESRATEVQPTAACPKHTVAA